MTQLDDDEALILARARRALAPTGIDQQRILNRLLPELALPTVAASGKPLPGPSWSLPKVGALAIMAAALTGGLGYKLGFQAGIAQNKPAVGRTAVVTAPRVVLPEESPRPTNEPSTPTASEVLPSAPAKPSPASAVPRVLRESSPAPSALGLDEEVRQLRRVERAIRENNPRFALVLLEELDHAIPAGQLLEERRAARIMANCQLGADSAVADARAFVAKRAASAYVTRVIALCGLGGERNSAAPGTHVPR